MQAKIKYSNFTWDFGKYKYIIAYSESYTLELDTQASFSKFSKKFKIVRQISRYSTFIFYFACICTREEPRKGKQTDFPPEDKYEVIRKSVSNQLDINMVNPSHKVWRDSTQTKTPTSPLHIGDSVRYTNEGHNYMVDMVDLNKNNPDSIKYSIKFLRGKEILVTK